MSTKNAVRHFTIASCWIGLIHVGACDPGTSTQSGAAIDPNQTSASGGSGAGTGEMPTWDTSSALGGFAGTGSMGSLPVVAQAWQPSEACVGLVAQRLSVMSWSEKIGQMVQGDSSTAVPGDVPKYDLGSILSGGGSDPGAGDHAAAWSAMVASYLLAGQSAVAPLLYGIDAVHGHNNVSNAVIFPHNIGLGCTRDAQLVEEIGRVTALEVRGTGINWTFAPVLAAARDERWGRTYESFGETPELAAWLGEAAVRGLQGASLSGDPTRILACAKHFAGDGATSAGVDQGNSTMTEADFRRLAIEQYQPAINAGVGSIMVSYSSHLGTKMSAHGHWLTDVLKGEMGFRGFLISDWQAIQQVPPTPDVGTEMNPAPTEAALVKSINAGLDMVMEPFHYPAVVAALSSAHSKGTISDARIDDAVTRILTVKCEMGMFSAEYQPAPDPATTARIGSAEHLALARRAVRQSIVLLKNDGHVLPLPKDGKILVVGEAADDKSKHAGGWTIDWQGIGMDEAHPGHSATITTVLAGIRAALGEAQVVYAADGITTETGFVGAVVVFGEKPYAEGLGNATDLSLSRVVPDSRSILERVAALEIPTAVVLLSGRPLIIADQFSQAGAWLAAWLPGSEGGGVADVLFGDYAPTGRLSHSWPRSNAQIPINVGDASYESDPPMFPYGYGLTY